MPSRHVLEERGSLLHDYLAVTTHEVYYSSCSSVRMSSYGNGNVNYACHLWVLCATHGSRTAVFVLMRDGSSPLSGRFGNQLRRVIVPSWHPCGGPQKLAQVLHIKWKAGPCKLPCARRLFLQHRGTVGNPDTPWTQALLARISALQILPSCWRFDGDNLEIVASCV